MARIEAKLAEKGLALPQPLQMPASISMSLPFAWVRLSGTRAFVSGHVPLNVDGTIAQPVGQVGAEVSPGEGYAAARLVALAQLASLQRALGDLGRITAWVRVFAMVNAAPDSDQMPRIANGFSDLILELFGPDIGMHARSAVGRRCRSTCLSNAKRKLSLTDDACKRRLPKRWRPAIRQASQLHFEAMCAGAQTSMAIWAEG